MQDRYAEPRVDRGRPGPVAEQDGGAGPGEIGEGRSAMNGDGATTGDRRPAGLDASMRAAADRVLARYPERRRDQLLPILQEVQGETGYLPRPLVAYLGERLG